MPKDKIPTTPAISYQVAQKISEIRFNAEPTEVKPILLYERNQLIWRTQIKSLYPFFGGINALTGNVLYGGAGKSDMPIDYDFGRNVEVKESSTIKKVYGE